MIPSLTHYLFPGWNGGLAPATQQRRIQAAVQTEPRDQQPESERDGAPAAAARARRQGLRGGAASPPQGRPPQQNRLQRRAAPVDRQPVSLLRRGRL